MPLLRVSLVQAVRMLPHQSIRVTVKKDDGFGDNGDRDALLV